MVCEALGQLATGLASQGLREKGSCWFMGNSTLLIDIKFPKFPWRFHLGGVYEVGGTIRADAGTGVPVGFVW